jgi:hypothetical protein
MSKALVFLRSFGDFTIAISVLRKSSILEGYVFYASKHLEPLYIDLKNSLQDIDLNIHFIDLDIKKKVFGFFTNKHSIELHSFRELMNLRRWVRDEGLGVEEFRGLEGGRTQLFFEQRRKQWMIAPFIGGIFPYIHKKSRNIYDSYLKHFGVAPEMLAFSTQPTNAIHTILVLPESRKKSKSFQPSFIHELASSMLKNEFDVTTAFFKNISTVPDGKVATHDSFTDLIRLIQAADLVVTADSLPAHLAQLLGKPHFVYYGAKPNQEWTTPFCNLNKAFGEMGDLSSLQTYLNAS